MKSEITIVAINHQMCLEKSYPKVDNAFHFNFSRYFDDFVPEKTEQKNENQSNNCLNNSFINISESEPNDNINNILTTNQFNEESTNDINSNNHIQIDQQGLEQDTIMNPFTTILNELQELRHNIELISENLTNMPLSERNESERNIQILESLNINTEFTEEDNQSIMRLVSAGHDRVNAIQIFVICDKNEEMALNLLSTIE